MSNTENLLEKIIQEKKGEELARLDAINIVESLFSELLDRERDILSRRFGLKGEKGETLEKIGRLHKLTRERVRQIEAASIKKIKKLDKLSDVISALRQVVKELLDEHGGLIRRDYLLDILSVISLEISGKNNSDDPAYESARRSYRQNFDFLLSRLLADELEISDKHNRFEPFFKDKNLDIDHLHDLADDLWQQVSVLKKTLSTEEILELLKKSETYSRNIGRLLREKSADIFAVFKSKVFPDKAEIINQNKILYSLLQAIRNLERNKFGQWGLADWGEIKPKTVNDKIYLVLKNTGQPLHFTEIAAKINEIKFDHKNANAATVHNELILDDRYVLVSRGTYGLKEWQMQAVK